MTQRIDKLDNDLNLYNNLRVLNVDGPENYGKKPKKLRGKGLRHYSKGVCWGASTEASPIRLDLQEYLLNMHRRKRRHFEFCFQCTLTIPNTMFVL